MTIEESLKIWRQIKPIIEASLNRAKQEAWYEGLNAAADYTEAFEFPHHHVDAIRALKSPYEEGK